MSKKERVVATIDLLKALILALIMAIFGIFGYVGVHVDDIGQKKIIIVCVGLLILFGFFYFAIRHLLKMLDDLEEM